MTSQREVGTALLSRAEHRAFMRLTREWAEPCELHAREATLNRLVDLGLAERFPENRNVDWDHVAFRIINVLEEKHGSNATRNA